MLRRARGTVKELPAEREVIAFVAKNACERLRFHDLRHCYPTWSISDRVPVKDVARLVGHKQISTTLNLYTHGTEEP
ncbi:UNVERIFIED_ORG: integrase [Microbispora rosea subsp. rosea]